MRFCESSSYISGPCAISVDWPPMTRERPQRGMGRRVRRETKGKRVLAQHGVCLDLGGDGRLQKSSAFRALFLSNLRISSERTSASGTEDSAMATPNFSANPMRRPLTSIWLPAPEANTLPRILQKKQERLKSLLASWTCRTNYHPQWF